MVSGRKGSNAAVPPAGVRALAHEALLPFSVWRHGLSYFSSITKWKGCAINETGGSERICILRKKKQSKTTAHG